MNSIKQRFIIDRNNFNKTVVIPKYLYVPYEFYFQILKNVNKQSEFLEIGVGTGNNTKSLINMFHNVCPTDIII